MAVLGLLFIGMLFGLLLSLATVAFAILRLDPRLRRDLAERKISITELLGGKTTVKAATASRQPELEQKLRTMQEEVRVSQKLLEQSRVERVANEEAMRKVQEELAAARYQLGEKDLQLKQLQDSMNETTATTRTLQADIALRDVDLSRKNTELRDLRTELEVAHAGDSVTVTQVERLQKERDALAHMVGRLKQELAVRQGQSGPRSIATGN